MTHSRPLTRERAALHEALYLQLERLTAQVAAVAQRRPEARSAASAIAVTDPFPLVPPTWTTLYARSGWPRLSSSTEMLCRPSLMPKNSRLDNQASGSSAARVTGP